MGVDIATTPYSGKPPSFVSLSQFELITRSPTDLTETTICQKYTA